jgi:STAS domain
MSNPVDVRRITRLSTLGTSERAIYWRRCWLGLESPAVPMVLLHTGYVARRFVALACLGRLASTASLPYRVSGLTFTDSMGAQAMLRVHRRVEKLGRRAVFVSPTRPVRGVLEVLGFDKIFNIES